MVVELLNVLVLAFEALHEEAKRLRLHVSMAKAKVVFEGLLDDS